MPWQKNKQNSLPCLVMGSVTTNTDELVVVGKYTQNKQGKLKAKMVKASHNRHYIKDPCRAQEKRGVIVILGKESKKSLANTEKENEKEKK